jgi:hypothetical protein
MEFERLPDSLPRHTNVKPGTRVFCRVASVRNRGALAHFRGEGVTEEVAGVVLDQVDDERSRVRFVLDGRSVDVVKLNDELAPTAENKNCSKTDDMELEFSLEQ